VPKTGVQYLIEAARKVIVYYDKVKFLIIGDGPLRSELESKVRISKLEKYFIFKGTIPNTEVQRYINIADFSVFPSLAEATSIAALEVMSCGKPVVSSNVGGLPEIIKNEYNGILVDFIKTDSDYSDYGLSKEVIDKLADAIIYMLKEDEKRIEMGQNARNFVVNNNSWESYVNKILEVYNIFK
jgi:glycosyltransferase involved in cell wall biosynthesis